MATFWRVQNASGVGPYQGVGSRSWCDSWEKHCDDDHPDPSSCWQNQWLNYYSYRPTNKLVKFGFVSEEQAHRWFSPAELKRLASLGFTLQKVEGELVFSHRTQVLIEVQFDKQ